MRWKQAIERGEMFYMGKICERHRELKGKRRTKNGNCHKCICERMKTVRAKAVQASPGTKEKAPSSVAS